MEFKITTIPKPRQRKRAISDAIEASINGESDPEISQPGVVDNTFSSEGTQALYEELKANQEHEILGSSVETADPKIRSGNLKPMTGFPLKLNNIDNKVQNEDDEDMSESFRSRGDPRYPRNSIRDKKKRKFKKMV